MVLLAKKLRLFVTIFVPPIQNETKMVKVIMISSVCLCRAFHVRVDLGTDRLRSGKPLKKIDGSDKSTETNATTKVH